MIIEKQIESNHKKPRLSNDKKKATPKPTLKGGDLDGWTNAWEELPNGWTSGELEALGASDDVVDLPHYPEIVYTEKEVYDLQERGKATSAPPLLTRGALKTTPLPLPEQKTHVDWLSFTCEETTEVIEELIKILLPSALVIPMKHGQTGYKYVKEISVSGMPIGRIGYGSTHGRNLLTFTGKGCALFKEWATFVHYYGLLTKPKITRIDIALDFFNGEVTHDLIIKAYAEEKFRLPNSSQNPTIKQEGSNTGTGINLGRTVYIGNKKSSKFIRCYEKGLERFGKLTLDLDEQAKAMFLNNLESSLCSDFDPLAPDTSLLDWYRLEVQYGNADRELTIDLLTKRDNYFSGAYPFLEEIIKMERKIPTRIPNALETDVEQMFTHIQNQYGSFLTTMLATGRSPEDILKKCINGKMSQRFIKAGGLDFIQPLNPEDLTKR